MHRPLHSRGAESSQRDAEAAVAKRHSRTRFTLFIARRSSIFTQGRANWYINANFMNVIAFINCFEISQCQQKTNLKQNFYVSFRCNFCLRYFESTSYKFRNKNGSWSTNNFSRYCHSNGANNYFVLRRIKWLIVFIIYYCCNNKLIIYKFILTQIREKTI